MQIKEPKLPPNCVGALLHIVFLVTFIRFVFVSFCIFVLFLLQFYSKRSCKPATVKGTDYKEYTETRWGNSTNRQSFAGILPVEIHVLSAVLNKGLTFDLPNNTDKCKRFGLKGGTSQTMWCLDPDDRCCIISFILSLNLFLVILSFLSLSLSVSVPLNLFLSLVRSVSLSLTQLSSSGTIAVRRLWQISSPCCPPSPR